MEENKRRDFQKKIFLQQSQNHFGENEILLVDEERHRQLVERDRSTFFCHDKFKIGNILIAGFLIFLFLAIATILPFYNNLLFNGSKTLVGYPYPLVASFLQMLVVAIFLLIWDILKHFVYDKNKQEDSWLFGKNFLIKLKYLWLPGICFGLVMSLSNMGIYEVKSVDTHVLLRSTEIVWVVLLAWVIQKQRPTLIVVGVCLCLIAGTTLISINLEEHTEFTSEYAIGLSINLASALVSALMTVVINYACGKLRNEQMNVPVLEMSLFKVIVGTLVIFPFTFVFEMSGWNALGGTSKDIQLLLVAGVFFDDDFSDH